MKIVILPSRASSPTILCHSLEGKMTSVPSGTVLRMKKRPATQSLHSSLRHSNICRLSVRVNRLCNILRPHAEATLYSQAPTQDLPSSLHKFCPNMSEPIPEAVPQPQQVPRSHPPVKRSAPTPTTPNKQPCSLPFSPNPSARSNFLPRAALRLSPTCKGPAPVPGRANFTFTRRVDDGSMSG